MHMASAVPVAYDGTNASATAVPEWLNKGDNAWQMLSATLVGLQGFPGLALFYAGSVHRKWALSSAFMALYATAAAMPCWALWAHNMLSQAFLPSTLHLDHLRSNGEVEAPAVTPLYPSASMVSFQWAFAGVTVGFVAGAVLGRMSVKAWMVFVPRWTTLSYTVGAYSMWGGGFLFHWGVMDYSGGYVVHLAAGVSGYTAAYRHLPVTNSRGLIYGVRAGGAQILKQVVAACFVTSIILILARVFLPLRMTDEELIAGDYAVHGEMACDNCQMPLNQHCDN